MHTNIYIIHTHNICSYYIHPLLLFINLPRSITYLPMTPNAVFCIFSLLPPHLITQNSIGPAHMLMVWGHPLEHD